MSAGTEVPLPDVFPGDMGGHSHAYSATALAAHVAAARADERRQAVALIRRMAAAESGVDYSNDALNDAADAIERGEHRTRTEGA